MRISQMGGKAKMTRGFHRVLQLAMWIVLPLGAPLAAGEDPSTVGQWSPVRTWPGPTEHSFLLPTGNVMFYPGRGAIQRWDPASDRFLGTGIQAFKYHVRPFRYLCSGHAFLADGKLLLAGGMLGKEGSPQAATYDPFTGVWARLPDMNGGRYYPTITTLSNGDALALSGVSLFPTWDKFIFNKLPQVFERATGRWRDLTSAERPLYYYPYCFVAPNDKVFFAGPGSDSMYLDTSGSGGWTAVARPLRLSRHYGSAVMYDEGKVLMIGGGNSPTATAEVIDLNSPQPAWRYVGSMAIPRHFFDATLLPDGQVIVTGGSSGPGDDSTQPALAAEIWDPNTESWTTLANGPIYRGLHSTALLLPDGRILKSGGNFSPRTAEIYSPPYLFKRPRPAIKSAPQGVAYGQEFLVETENAAEISKVTLLRLGAVTHDFNQNQRFNKLEFWQVRGGIMVRAPSTGALCPPGHYMLFILNGNSVPSVAKIIQVSRTIQQSKPSTSTKFPWIRGRR